MRAGLPIHSLKACRSSPDVKPGSVVLNGSCDAGESGVFSATVTQAARSRVASGNGFIALTCTGETQQAKFVVAASGSGAPFHVGTALVSAGIVFGCCSGVSTTEVVRITR